MTTDTPVGRYSQQVDVASSLQRVRVGPVDGRLRRATLLQDLYSAHSSTSDYAPGFDAAPEESILAYRPRGVKSVLPSVESV